MKDQRAFSAKIMLFGEYSILLGSPALSIPFGFFSATLRIPRSEEDHMISRFQESNKMLREFYNKSLLQNGVFPGILDLKKLKKELDSGIFLDSTIPSKYGAGSSGALCAALYDRYAYEPLCQQNSIGTADMIKLRTIFISMESFFHGKSSGLDPLVIYLHHPLIINENGQTSWAVIPGDLMTDKGKIFLVDTGQSRGTATLVPSFLQHYSRQGDKEKEGEKLCELNHLCITQLCELNAKKFLVNLKLLSDFQFQNLGPMIPGHMRNLWSEGLDKNLFFLKLCGSGGGGFLIGFTMDYKSTLEYFRKQNIGVIPVDIDDTDRINF